MAGYNDPKLLYAIKGINAYHIEKGREECLTPSGPQTLSLLMVPTSPPVYDPADPQNYAPEEDFYLHLHIPPELDLPLPATTQIYHQPPSSYLIPRAWDLGPERGAFTRIEFPGIGKGGSQEDVDTFETILAQCTAFLERAPPPKAARRRKSKSTAETIPPYDPSTFKPGEGYVQGSASSHVGGQIVLVDEENGSVVGELGEGFHVVEDSKLQAGSKDPVEITLPEDGSLNIGVAPASARYLEADMHPAYQNSTIVSKAVAASRLIITTSEYVSKTLQVQAKEFTRTTKPNAEPLSFTPTTRDRIRKVHNFSAGAAGLSAKTVSQVSKYAQNIGASLAKHGQKGGRGIGPDGKPIEGFQPGLLNKSMMAFSTIADGIDYAGRNLLASSSTAATTVVTHKYGPEAGEVTKSIGGGMKNVALVYIDAAGVSRRAIVKSVVKGMTVGRVSGGGGDVIVPDTDDGVVSPVPSAIDKKKNWKEREAAEGRYTDDASMSGGKAPPPAYGSSIGDNIEGQKFSIDSKVIYK